MILVTGGAGFIGANFVLDWLAAEREPVVNLDKLTYAGQPRQPRGARGRSRATASCAATSATRALVERPAGPSTGRAPSSTSPPRATSTARSTARRRSSRPTSSAPSGCSRAAREYWRGARGRGARALPLPARLDRRGVRLARRRRSGVHRDHAVRAQQPVLGLQGRLRPPRARLPPHLRPAGAHHELLEQLRPVPVPGEADPADDRQRARGQAAAGLRRRRERARLAVRRRPLQRASARVLDARPRRRGLQHRRRRRDDEPRRRAGDLRARSTSSRPRARRLPRDADHLRRDRPGHDRRYAIDARKIQARARLVARARPSRAGSRARCAGTSTTPTWVASVQSGEYRQLDRPELRARARRARERERGHAQGHHPRRRLRHAAVSGDAGRLQAAAAGLRQADDLLPAVDADARGHPRHPADHLDAAGHAALRAAARRRQQWGLDIAYAVQPSPGRARAGVHHRPRLRRRRPRLRWCSATTSSTATTCRRCCRRARSARAGRDGLRLPGAAIPSATAWSSSTRSGRVVEPRGEAGGAQVALRGDRALLLRQPRGRHRARACKPSAARRARDHRREPAATSSAATLRRARCWAAASRGSTPARTSRCSRRRTSSRPSSGARASRSPARRRSPTAWARSTRRRSSGWRARRWPRTATAATCSACCATA